MNKAVIALLLSTTVIFGGLYFSQTGAVKKVEVENPLNAKLEADVKGLESKVKLLDQENAKLKEQIKHFETVKSEQKKIIKTDPETGEKKVEIAQTNNSPFLRMLQDPKMQEMMKERRNRMVQDRYGYLFSKLNLSEDQKARLVDLLGERSAAGMAAGMKARMSQNDEDRAAANEEREQAYADTDAKIADLLGADYDTYTDYKQKEDDYREVDGLNRGLGDDKLDDSQKEQLASIMNQTKSSFQFSNEKVNESRWNVYSLNDEEKAQYVKELEERDEMILKESESFLTEKQLQELKKEQAEDRERVTRRRGRGGDRGGRRGRF